MASLREIKAHIGNINATKKVTRAMHLIAASKSQKAKNQLENTLPYFNHITATLAEIVTASEELYKGIETPYVLMHQELESPPPPSDLYIVLAADKGMAGGYNHSLEEYVARAVRKDADELLVAGFMGRLHFHRQGYQVDETFVYPVMEPSVHRAREIAERVIEKYHSRRYRDIHIIFTQMFSSMRREPVSLKLLPLDPAALCLHAPPSAHQDEIAYLPSARAVFHELVPHYLKGIIYSAMVEAFASEQLERMIAMAAATKGAGETIARLSVQYNRARQAKITQELIEIIGGIPQA